MLDFADTNKAVRAPTHLFLAQTQTYIECTDIKR